MTGCQDVQVSMSALRDGEQAPLDHEAVQRHTADCAACAAFAAALPALDQQVAALRALPVPDRTATVLTGSPAPEAATPGRRVATRDLRWLVGLAAAVQVVVAVVALVGGGGDHLARDLAVLELATAGGLAAAAWRPGLAAGLVPVVAVAAGAGVLASAGDLLSGASSLATELSHLVLLVALWPVVALARRSAPAATVRPT